MMLTDELALYLSLLDGCPMSKKPELLDSICGLLNRLREMERFANERVADAQDEADADYRDTRIARSLNVVRLQPRLLPAAGGVR